MTNQEIATALVDLCKQGKFLDAIDSLYADDAVSVEAKSFNGMPRETHGKAAIRGKGEWWEGAHEIHSMAVDGPFVSPEYFAVVFSMDVTMKATGKRVQGREVALYTVANGKVIRDEFLMDA